LEHTDDIAKLYSRQPYYIRSYKNENTGITEQQKVGKQGRDDNKTFQYTTFLHIDLLPKLQKKIKNGCVGSCGHVYMIKDERALCR